jgi:hypothetical protein
MLQGSRRQTPPKYAPRLANLGIVDFFNLGCGWLSRFSNHEELLVDYILAKDKATVPERSILQTVKVTPTRTVQRILTAYACALMVLCLVLVFGPAVHTFSKPQISVRPVVEPGPNQRESPMTKQASGTFEVSLTPQEPDNNAAYAASGIGSGMPRSGLCRVTTN